MNPDTACNRLYNRVMAALEEKFPLEHNCVAISVVYDPAGDMPFIIRMGEVAGECIDVDGYDVEHALQRFKAFGLAMVRSRIDMMKHARAE